MSKLCVFTVRDRAADVYGAPFFMPTPGMAIRGFSDLINAKDSKDLASQHPQDFDLYHLGYYDDATASFEQFERPQQIAVGHQLRMSVAK